MVKSDKVLLQGVGVGILACGLVFLMAPTVGRILLNFIFLFYVLVRAAYYGKIWKKPFLALDKQRLVLVSILAVCVLLNFVGLSQSYFLPILLIALEYLRLVNNDKQPENQ